MLAVPVALAHEIGERHAVGRQRRNVSDERHPQPVVLQFLDELTCKARGESQEGRLESRYWHHDDIDPEPIILSEQG